MGRVRGDGDGRRAVPRLGRDRRPCLDGVDESVDDAAQLGTKHVVHALGEPGVGLRDADRLFQRAGAERAKDLCVSAAAQTPPNKPVLEESTATGLFRTGESASGRDAQSKAFLSTPGIEELYSGVATRTASAASSASLKSSTAAGSAPGTSSSPSYGGIALSPSKRSTVTPAGASAAAARRSALLCEPCRRLPLIARILMPYAWTSARLAVIRTSSASICSPDGSSWPQSIPKSRRLIVVSTSRPRRWLP